MLERTRREDEQRHQDESDKSLDEEYRRRHEMRTQRDDAHQRYWLATPVNKYEELPVNRYGVRGRELPGDDNPMKALKSVVLTDEVGRSFKHLQLIKVNGGSQ